MNEAVRGLLRSMDELVRLHRTLITLTELQKQALLGSDAEVLQDLVTQIEQVSSEVLTVEQERIEFTSQIAVSREITSDITAEDLLTFLSGPEQDRFKKVAATLRDLVVQLVEANDRNRLLTEQSLEYMGRIVGMVAGLTRKSNNYGPGKRNAQGQGARMFDVHA